METKRVEIELLTEMLGTVTKDPEVYKTFIESKKPKDVTEEEYLTVEKIEEKGWTGFHRDEEGIFIFNYMIKGFLKHSGNVLKDNLKIKNLRSKIDDYLFVSPRKIRINGEVEGIIERPLRAMTMQGPRVTLARSDFLKIGTILDFEISLIENKEINWKVIELLLDYGKFMGLGQFRNGGYGQFIWKFI